MPDEPKETKELEQIATLGKVREIMTKLAEGMTISQANILLGNREQALEVLTNFIRAQEQVSDAVNRIMDELRS